jgi:FMN phosphatase YigB (HAD superfamily)
MNTTVESIVLLDIDHTLFDTDTYRVVCFKDIIKKSGFLDAQQGLEVAEELYKSMRKSGYFKTQLFVTELCAQLNVQSDAIVLQDSFFDEKNIKKSLYPDVEEVLEALGKKENIRIGIFSGGQADMQRKKIASLVHVLEADHIHINEVDKLQDIPDVLQRYADKKVYIVDDLAAVLERFKQENEKVTTILIARDGKKVDTDTKEEYQPDLHIANLRELTTIIQ